MNLKQLEAQMIEQIKTGNVPKILDHVSNKDDKSMIIYILVQKAAGRQSIDWGKVRANMGWKASMGRDTMYKRYMRALQGLCEVKN